MSSRSNLPSSTVVEGYPTDRTEMNYLGRRRSNRYSLAIPVAISGLDLHGASFTENTRTITLSEYGGKLATSHRLATQSEITIKNLAQGSVCKARVVTTEKGLFPEVPFEIGVELTESVALWGFKFSGPDQPMDHVDAPVSTTTDSATDQSSVLSPSSEHTSASATSDNSTVYSVSNPIPSQSVQTPTAKVEAAAAKLKPNVEASKLLDLQSKIESAKADLDALLAKAEDTRKLLDTQVDEAERRAGQITGPGLASAIQECSKKLETTTSSLVRAGVIQAREEAGSIFRQLLDKLFAQQLAESSERMKGEIQSQQVVFKAQVDSMAANAVQVFVGPADALRKEAQAEIESHLEYAASQMRQETCDALVLLKEDIQQSQQTARIAHETELERFGEAIRQRSRTEMQAQLDQSLASLREQIQAVYQSCPTPAQTAQLVAEEIERVKSQHIEKAQLHYQNELEQFGTSIGQRGKAEMQAYLDKALSSLREEFQNLHASYPSPAQIADSVAEQIARSETEKMEAVKQRAAVELEILLNTHLATASERWAALDVQLAAASERAAAKIGQTLEGEYQRKIDRIFAEAMDNRIRDFEARLAMAVEDRLANLNTKFAEHLDSAAQNAEAKIRENSVQVAKAVLEVIQQEAGSVSAVIKDSAAQSIERMESVARSAAFSSQQQIAKFRQEALNELHQEAEANLGRMRDRFLKSAAVLSGDDNKSGIEKRADSVTAHSADIVSDNIHTEDHEPTKNDLPSIINDDIKAQVRARLNEILKPTY